MAKADKIARQAQEIRDRIENAINQAVRRFLEEFEERDFDPAAIELGIEWAELKRAAISAILMGETRTDFVEMAGAVFDENNRERFSKQGTAGDYIAVRRMSIAWRDQNMRKLVYQST